MCRWPPIFAPLRGIAKLIETVVGALGGLDVLVCAAAVLVRRAHVDDVSEADWDYSARYQSQIDLLP